MIFTTPAGLFCDEFFWWLFLSLLQHRNLLGVLATWFFLSVQSAAYLVFPTNSFAFLY